MPTSTENIEVVAGIYDKMYNMLKYIKGYDNMIGTGDWISKVWRRTR